MCPQRTNNHILSHRVFISIQRQTDLSHSAEWHWWCRPLCPACMFSLPRTSGKQPSHDISSLSVSQFIFHWHFSTHSKQINQQARYLWREGAWNTSLASGPSIASHVDQWIFSISVSQPVMRMEGEQGYWNYFLKEYVAQSIAEGWSLCSTHSPWARTTRKTLRCLNVHMRNLLWFLMLPSGL